MKGLEHVCLPDEKGELRFEYRVAIFIADLFSLKDPRTNLHRDPFFAGPQ